mmetsp:Transcript_18295/g.27179  ORF Transcript_18295/g.27179 Transcript_18295/m.27179 type:complete len:512 (-) Transcript_18295:213-1748(-)
MSDFTGGSLSFRIEYADGEEVSGRHCKDTLHWAGLEVPDCIFAQVTHLGNYEMCIVEDGIFGLAFSALNRHDFKSPFQHVADSGVISSEKTVFSFYLHPEDDFNDEDELLSSAAGGGSKSKLIVGGVDRTLYSGCLTWLNVPKSETENVGFWEFSISKIQVGGDLNQPLHHDGLYGGSLMAILDSGSTNFVGPASAISDFVAYNNATCYGITLLGELEEQNCRDTSIFGWWDIASVACHEPIQPLEFVVTDKITFSFGYDELVYSMTVEDEETGEDLEICLVNVTPDRDTLGGERWVLGDTFLQKYYAAFDWSNHRLGFAPNILNATDDTDGHGGSADLCAADADLDIHFSGDSDGGDDNFSPSEEPSPVAQSIPPVPAPVEGVVGTVSPAPSFAGSTSQSYNGSSGSAAPTLLVTATQSPVTQAPIITKAPVISPGSSFSSSNDSNDVGSAAATSDISSVFVFTLVSVSMLVGLVLYFKQRRRSVANARGIVRGQMLPNIDLDSDDHEII